MDNKQFEELNGLLAQIHKQLVLIASNTQLLLAEARQAKKVEAPTDRPAS